MLSDEQMSKRLPFSLLNNEQMSNWLGVEHQPVTFFGLASIISIADLDLVLRQSQEELSPKMLVGGKAIFHMAHLR